MIIPLRICSAIKLDIAEKPHFKGRDAETPLFLRKTPPIPLDRQPPRFRLVAAGTAAMQPRIVRATLTHSSQA